MTGREKVIADILRVNHAGERAAVRIYQAQIWIAQWRAPTLISSLREILGHEKNHRDIFLALMKANRITPCRALTIWGIGGFGFGAFTAVLGKQAILTCTASVERTVHRHLNDQLRWLGTSEPAISKAIADIQSEELGHLDWAERQRQASSMGATLDWLIAFGTDALIWLSTYGAAGRMRRDIRS